MELKVSVTTKGKIFEGKGPEIIKANLTEAMYEAISFLEKEVKRRVPVGVFGAQGGLLSTIHGEVQGKGTPAVKGIIAHQKGEYGDVIEEGRRAGKTWPPEGVLLRWIEVKLGVEGNMAKQLEFIIRRKIGKKGFEGVHMFERALDENFPKLQAIFDRCGFEIARGLNE